MGKSYISRIVKNLSNGLGEDSSIFRSILRSILIIVPVPVIIIAVVAIVSSYLLEKTVNEFEVYIMERISSEIDLDFESVAWTMAQASKNETVLNYARKEERDYYEEIQVIAALDEIKNGNFSIEEIYLYLPQFDKVFSTSRATSSAKWHESNYGNDYEEWLAQMEGSRRWKFQSIQGKGEEIRTILSASIGAGNAQIVIQIDNNYLRKCMEQLCFSDGEAAFLFLGNGMIVETSGMGDDWSREALFQAVEKKGTNIRIEGQSYGLFYEVSPRWNLTLVRVVPAGSSHVAVLYSRQFQFFAVIACLIFLGILAYIAASRSYAPIRKLSNLIEEMDEARKIRNYEDMEAYVRTSSSGLKELQKTVLQYEEDIQKLYLCGIVFRGADIPRNSMLYRILNGKYYAVFLCVVNQETETEEGLIQSEDEVIKDILYAYAGECLPVPESQCILQDKGNMYCVLNGNEEAEFERITDQCLLLKQSLAEKENIFCDIYVSSVFEKINDLHKGYVEVNAQREAAEELLFGENDEEDSSNAYRVVEMIQENISDSNLSANGIADSLKITPWQLTRLFKAKMNMGVLEYIHQCRIEKAMELLKCDKNLKVKEAADSVGFYNVATFIRVFKKLTGVTPGQYREMQELDRK